MERVYVVSRIGFEYNDEIYRQTECTAHREHKAFRSLQKAEEEALRLNLADLRSVDLMSYGYDLEDIVGYENETGLELLRKHGCDSIYDINETISAMSDDDLKDLASQMQIRFYEVTQVDLVD